MAEPLKYTPTAPPTTETAHEELEDLIETLHESGTLRVLNGFFGQFDDVTEVALEQLTTPSGMQAVSNLAILMKGLTNVDPDHLETFQEGTQEGLEAARESLKEKPPGMFKLTRQFGDRDTRRGMHAALTLLQTLGRHLHENLDEE